MIQNGWEMLANLILARLVGWTMQLVNTPLFVAAEACWFTSFDEKAWMEARMTMNQPAQRTDTHIHKLTGTSFKSPTYRTKPEIFVFKKTPLFPNQPTLVAR